MSPLPGPVLELLTRSGLLGPGERPPSELFTGGVSSDIWRVDLARGPVCVKRARAKLKVTQEWYVPVRRNASEVDWYETVAGIVPKAVPRVLAHDPAAGFFVMEYLPPASNRSWKEELRQGHANPAFAARVGADLARIHSATGANAEMAARFATDEVFHAIRLEPYLAATATVHPDLQDRLMELYRITAENRHAVVHGDVSPKNILIGPDGPIFIDAECAWYGDPAFDLAFCLKHFLLKCLWTPPARTGFLACFDAMIDAYEPDIPGQNPAAIKTRIAHLLPGLFLGRVDGKSPVEYVTREEDKNRVRRCARRLLVDPVNTPAEVRMAWAEELET
ncbi:MAG: aminoglycoside phosphotransferase family protein [Rhodospirillales bacterium]|nr:aminoglycoside phosphotransferase family protein [Rhodospirillales bacterium]